MGPRNDENSFAEDALQREGGVLVSAAGGHKSDVGADGRAQDDYVEDEINEPGVPGTVDDLPYDYGVENASPADEALGSIDRTRAWQVGATGAADDREPGPLGRPEERELWSKQRPLIEEAQANEREYGSLDEGDLPRIVDSSIDAEDALSETPDGTSATGSSTAS
ncbi:MAG: hypothetical protein WBI63_04685 [Coriobacteriia bacterium]